MASKVKASDSRGSGERSASMSAADRIGRSIDGPFALDEVEGDAHRLERQQQIGKQDGGVHLDAADRLQRDLGGQVGRPTQLQKRVVLAERSIFGHVPAGLPHEPDGRAIDGLAPAGAEKSALAHPGASDHACYIIEFVSTPEVQ